MPAHLPDLSRDEFRARLDPYCPSLTESAGRDLWVHYQELRRWAGRLALVGAGEADRIVERHYGESLMALPLIDAADGVVFDLGSGAGFPGCPLAAARRDLDVWLAESRVRKAAFLRAACAKAGLPCRILGARVSRREPVTGEVPEKTIDLVTVRGVRVNRDIWAGLEPGLAAGARVLRWEGALPVEPWPDARPGRTVDLGGRGRKIREWIHRPKKTQQ